MEELAFDCPYAVQNVVQNTRHIITVSTLEQTWNKYVSQSNTYVIVM